jgi:hypothetical protein
MKLFGVGYRLELQALCHYNFSRWWYFRCGIVLTTSANLVAYF